MNMMRRDLLKGMGALLITMNMPILIQKIKNVEVSESVLEYTWEGFAYGNGKPISTGDTLYVGQEDKTNIDHGVGFKPDVFFINKRGNGDPWVMNDTVRLPKGSNI